MRISYTAALATPIRVVTRQLEYHNIEKHIKEQKIEEQNAKLER